MNIHENARTTPTSRALLVRRVLQEGWSTRHAAEAAGVSRPTVYKWLRRYRDAGAGHDAMKLHEIMPQAMLFVRGQNSGISHNPLESTTSDDIELAVHAFGHLLDNMR